MKSIVEYVVQIQMFEVIRYVSHRYHKVLKLHKQYIYSVYNKKYTEENMRKINIQIKTLTLIRHCVNEYHTEECIYCNLYKN